MVCSREGSMPKFLSGVHVTFRTPITALIFEVSAEWYNNVAKVCVIFLNAKPSMHGPLKEKESFQQI